MASTGGRIKAFPGQDKEELKIAGKLVVENNEAITLQMRNSLFEIPRSQIIERAGGDKIGSEVSLSVAPDVKILQTVIRPAAEIGPIVGGGVFATHQTGFAAESRCDCDCMDCDCRCDCDCDFVAIGSPAAREGLGFRTPLPADRSNPDYSGAAD